MRALGPPLAPAGRLRSSAPLGRGASRRAAALADARGMAPTAPLGAEAANGAGDGHGHAPPPPPQPLGPHGASPHWQASTTATHGGACHASRDVQSLGGGEPPARQNSSRHNPGERGVRPVVSDALAMPIVQTSTYTFKDTAELIRFQARRPPAAPPALTPPRRAGGHPLELRVRAVRQPHDARGGGEAVRPGRGGGRAAVLLRHELRHHADAGAHPGGRALGDHHRLLPARASHLCSRTTAPLTRLRRECVPAAAHGSSSKRFCPRWGSPTR